MFGRKTSGSTAPPVPATPKPAPRRAVMSEGKQAYEERRAKEAGLSLDAWLARKRTAATPAAAAPKRPARRPPGLLSRLLDRAHRPLK